MSAVAPRMDSDDEHTSSVVKRKTGGVTRQATPEESRKGAPVAPSRKGWPWIVKAAGMGVAAWLAAFISISAFNAVRFHLELCRVRDAVRALQLPEEAMPVLVPAYSRPEYLRPVLQAIVDADGFEETVVVVSQDGNKPGITSLIQEFSDATGGRVMRMWHTQPYLNFVQTFIWSSDAPTAANVKHLLTLALEYLEAPGGIVIESDIQPSPDFYRYFQWAEHHVTANPGLQERVFTVNGFHHESSAEADPFTMSGERYGFMVWGWLCPAHSWPLIRDNWTWYHNWDITMEYSIRRGVAGNGLVSLSPAVSRVRNIGMTGINFNIPNPETQRQWLEMYTPPAPIQYRDKVGAWKPMVIAHHPLGPQEGKTPAGTPEALDAILGTHSG